MVDNTLFGIDGMRKDSFTHHGIKGQKWGVKNGPPYPLNSSNKSSSFKTPKDLSSFMKKHISYSEYTTLKSPEQTMRSRKGSCHDQVLLEFSELRKMGLKPKGLFFIEYDDSGKGGTTHSIAYYNQNGKTHYIENAWGGKEGLKSFDNEKKLVDYMVKLKEIGEYGDNVKYPKFLITELKDTDHKTGETLTEFVDIATSKKEVYNGQHTKHN